MPLGILAEFFDFLVDFFFGGVDGYCGYGAFDVFGFFDGVVSSLSCDEVGAGVDGV